SHGDSHASSCYSGKAPHRAYWFGRGDFAAVLECFEVALFDSPLIRSPRGTPWDVTAGAAWQALFARRVSPSSPPVASVRAVRLPDARPWPIRRFAELATTPSLSFSAISVSICALESTPNRRTSPGRA